MNVQVKANEAMQTSSSPRKFLTNLIRKRESSLFLVLLTVCILMSLARPQTFFTEQNFFNILRQVSLVTIIAAGQTFIMISGGIDLSVGFNMGLVGIITALFLSLGLSPVFAIILGISTGILVGSTNGILITKLKLPPFIITLGMANIARGFTLVITEGFTIPIKNEFILSIGRDSLGPVPIMTIIMLLVIVFSVFLLNETVFGNKVKAIGGNEEAAKLSGISITRNKILTYGYAGLLCSIAGIIMLGRLNAGNPNAGTGYDMESIAATIVGGTSLQGGDGTVIGTLFGAILLGVIKTGLVLLDVNMFWQTVATGVIIISVCSLDMLARTKKSAK